MSLRETSTYHQFLIVSKSVPDGRVHDLTGCAFKAARATSQFKSVADYQIKPFEFPAGLRYHSQKLLGDIRQTGESQTDKSAWKLSGEKKGTSAKRRYSLRMKGNLKKCEVHVRQRE